VPDLRFAFEARVAVGEEEHVGHGEGDEVRFVPIVGAFKSCLPNRRESIVGP
jgi:hypothetical protein